MTTRRTLSDRGVLALRPRAARYSFPDPEMRGLWIRVQSSGSKSFAVVARARTASKFGSGSARPTP